MSTIENKAKSPLDLLLEKANKAMRDAASAYRHLGAMLALTDVDASIEAYEESLRLQPGQGDVIVRLHGLHEQQDEERYGDKAMKLRALVRQSLVNAKENGYCFEIDDEYVADDLLRCDADIEGENRDDVIAAVAAVRKENAE